MLYDNYRNRILRISAILAKIVRHLPLIIAAAAFLLVTVITLMATKGIVGKTTCTPQIVYGETLQYEANAFLSRTRFEFRSEGSEEWSSEEPRMPGQYYLRAAANASFGGTRYGKEIPFSIRQKELSVHVVEDSIVYGELLSTSAALLPGERLVCDGFLYDDIQKEETNVCADKSAIKITDARGNDVTAAYLLATPKKPLTFQKRGITITVQNASQEYNGERFSYDQYELSGGSLAEGDRLQTRFEKYLIDVGTVVNQPVLQIVNANGDDVTIHYAVTENIGSLTVEKRPLIITTGSLETVYADEDVSCGAYTVDASTSLVEGHRIVVVASTTRKTVGTYKNSMQLKIVDAAGNDQTHNYALLIEEGTLVITKRPVALKTENGSWVYDGMEHMSAGYTAIGLVDSHVARLESAAAIRFVGRTDNAVTISIWSGEEDVTANYAFTYHYGRLAISKRPITVMALSESFVYDAYAHTGEKILVTSPLGLAEGDIFRLSDKASITDVGSVENTMKVDVVSAEDGTSRTRNYEITVQYGTLTVTPRPITIVTASDSWIYDSYTHSNTWYEITSALGLADGHEVLILSSTELTDVGKAKNEFNFEIRPVLQSGRYKTKNYSITVICGTLEVTPRPVRLETASETWIYDGQSHSNTGHITLSELGIADHDRLEAHAYPTITDVGRKVNRYSYSVVSETGENKIGNYYLTVQYGMLEVVPRPIILKPIDVEKVYDGFPLYGGGPEIAPHSPYSLVEGHTVSSYTLGSRVEVGESPSRLMNVTILSGNIDVSRNYAISLEPGKITIYEKELPPPPPPRPPEDPHMLVGKFKSDASEVVYLRQESFGDYNGQVWKNATPYPYLLPGGYSYNFLSSFALMNSGAKVRVAEMIECQLYMLPYYLGPNGDYKLPQSDTVYDADLQQYTMTYYSMADYLNNPYLLQGYLGEYAAEEEKYREFVYETYLTIDYDTFTYMQGIIAAQGFTRTDPGVIAKIASYIQHAADYNLGYDPKMDLESNVVIAFLDSYKEGICVHYASAATLLYRALGIPARYVQGFMIETKAGSFVDVTTPGHAWVEVYIDGVGWMQVEVTGSLEEELPKPTIEIMPSYQYKIDDGEPLFAKDVIDADQVLSELLARGYTYTVKVSGVQKRVGQGVSKITHFILYDPSGQDVTDQFEVVCQPGVLEILPKDTGVIRLYLYQLQKYYDGTPLFFEDGDYEIIEMEEGLELQISFHIFLTDVGSLSLAEINKDLGKYITYSVYRDGKDVTEGYIIIFEKLGDAAASYVPIRVDKRRLEVTTATDSKVYDGKALQNAAVDITKGSLASGHRMEASAIGSIDSVGDTKNSLGRLVIYDEYGNDVTDNYDITVKTGTLTVVAPEE